MKKYIPVFGPQELFDGAAADIIAIRVNDYKKITYYYHNEEDLKSKSMQDLHAIPLIAMRRIEEIPEPKRWTLEDKKAGWLPEVGCRAIWHDDNGMKYTVKIETAFFGNECAVSIDDEAIYFAEKFCLFPIETPAEKAQREEDEFVSGIVFEYDKMPSSVLFEAGIRAAYRKLKGGE